jgi:putative ABC transport system permease protein
MIKLALKYITKNKKISVICLLGMTISIILLFSLVQIGQMIIDSYKSMMLSSSNFDLFIDNLDYEKASEIYKDYEKKYGLAEANFFATNIEDEIISNEIIGVLGDWQTVFSVKMLDGNSPEKDNDIVVEEKYAQNHKLSVGDTVDLELVGDDGQANAEFVVSGIMSNTAAYSSGSYMMVSLKTARDLQNKFKLNIDQAKYTDYFVVSKGEYPEDEISSIYQGIFDKYGKEILSIIKVNETKSELNENKGAYFGMRQMIWGIILFVIVTMIIFVYYMMKVNIQNQINQYGILMAIGGKIGDLQKLIAYQLIIYGVAGFVLGNIGGFVFNNLMAKKILKLLIPQTAEIVNVPITIMLYIGIIEVMILCLVWGTYAVKLNNKMPIELVHKKELFLKKKNHSANSVEFDLILNNCSRNRRNNILLVITTFLACSLVIILINGVKSVSFDINKSVFSFARLEADIPVGVEEAAFEKRQLDELDDLLTQIYKQNVLNELKVYINGEEKTCNVIVYSNNLMDKLIDINKLDKNTCVVFSTKNGEEIERVELENKSGTTVVKVDHCIAEGWSNLIGKQAPYAEYNIIIDEKYASENLGFDDTWGDLYIAGDEGTEEEIRDILSDSKCEFYNLDNIIGQANNQLRGMLVLIAYMIVAIVFLAVFLITSIVRENFECRKKEIGMMIAVGARKGQVTSILCGEMLLLILVAEMFALIVSIPVSAYIYQVINDKAGLELVGFIVGIPLVVILSGIVVFINVQKCLQGKAIDLLRCED